MHTFNFYFRVARLVALAFVFTLATQAQTSTLTYQGRLSDTTLPAAGTYDFQFALYHTVGGNNQIGTTLTRSGTTVNTGVFTVQLDFGTTAFPGADLYLELRVKKPTETTYTTLQPRRLINRLAVCDSHDQRADGDGCRRALGKLRRLRCERADRND